MFFDKSMGEGDGEDEIIVKRQNVS